MKRLLVVPLLVCAAVVASGAEADLKAAVSKAARALGDKANFTWTTTSKAESGPELRLGPVEGQSEKGGFSWFKSSVGDVNYACAFKGDKSAIQRDGEWQGTDELQGNDEWIAKRLKEYKLPVAELVELAGHSTGLKKGDDGLISGALTEEGVKTIAARMGRGPRSSPEPIEPKGTVKFWIKDGVIEKCEFNVQMRMLIGKEEKDTEISRTTTIEIKEVGKTKLDLPEEAKKKVT